MLGDTRDRFLETYITVVDARCLWVPRAFKEVRVLLKHPDMTNEI